ncbi:MAG: hypothetical protein IMZ61_04645 [Planctomycetes bacterium]|nr:hypothetical protein [Planctomycetota bacterium]
MPGSRATAMIRIICPSIENYKRGFMDQLGIIVKETPFMPERGGQASDAGYIEGDGFRFRVERVTEPVERVIVHWGHFEGVLRD